MFTYNGSIWAVDSIHNLSGIHEKYSVIRMIHHTYDRMGGVRYFLADSNCIEKYNSNSANSLKLDFGNNYFLNFEHSRKCVNEIAFGVNKYRIPVIEAEHLDKFFNRSPQTENELEHTISKELRKATEISSEIVEGAFELKNPVTQKYKARIYTFNVGQGDSIILEFENGEIWMIDAFFWGQKKYSFFENWMNSKYRNPRINRLIISHFHNDHIRSALKIIKYFNPSEVIVPSSLVHKTSIVRNLLVGIPHNNTLRTLSKIEKINYNGLEISILPTSCLPSNKCRKSKDPNENELIVTVEANNKIVLLVGDTPGHILNDLNNCFTVNNKEIYYKVSHHCSRTGIGQLFLQNFKPYYAVTSCGIKNRYGHPHSPPQDEIIKFCNGNNGRYFRTYEKKEPIMWEI